MSVVAAKSSLCSTGHVVVEVVVAIESVEMEEVDSRRSLDCTGRVGVVAIVTGMAADSIAVEVAGRSWNSLDRSLGCSLAAGCSYCNRLSGSWAEVVDRSCCTDHVRQPHGSPHLGSRLVLLSSCYSLLRLAS